jgi:hypothetical protein
LFLGDRAGKLEGRRHQVIGRDHLVHELDAISLSRVDDPTGQHEFSRHPDADDLRQQVTGTHVHRR